MRIVKQKRIDWIEVAILIFTTALAAGLTVAVILDDLIA